MKKLLMALVFGLLTLSPCYAQQGVRSHRFTIAGPDSAINLVNTAIAYHQITWNVSGTASACTVALDTSTNGTSWTSGGAIAGQTCTSNGMSTVAHVVANYVRIHMTALTVTPGSSVTVTWDGYVNNPGGGGGGSVVDCTVEGGVAYENGTDNTLTCGGNAVENDPNGEFDLSVISDDYVNLLLTNQMSSNGAIQVGVNNDDSSYLRATGTTGTAALNFQKDGSIFQTPTEITGGTPFGTFAGGGTDGSLTAPALFSLEQPTSYPWLFAFTSDSDTGATFTSQFPAGDGSFTMRSYDGTDEPMIIFFDQGNHILTLGSSGSTLYPISVQGVDIHDVNLGMQIDGNSSGTFKLKASDNAGTPATVCPPTTTASATGMALVVTGLSATGCDGGAGQQTSWQSVGSLICSGTISLPTSSVSSGGKYGASSSTPLQTTCTGMATTDNVILTFNSDPTSSTGYSPSTDGMLTIISYPDAGGGKIDLYLINNTANPITPSAATLNYRVIR